MFLLPGTAPVLLNIKSYTVVQDCIDLIIVNPIWPKPFRSRLYRPAYCELYQTQPK